MNLKQKEKPKYNMWQNSAYMLKLAWKQKKTILFTCFIIIAVSVISNLTNLFIAPAILNKIEVHAPLNELIFTILFFSTALIAISFINEYVSENAMFDRIDLRLHILSMISYKFSTTSYPNTLDKEVLTKYEKANRSTCGNNVAAEAIWNTLIQLLQNLICFIIYLFLLSHLNIFLAATVIILSIASYLFNKKNKEWGYKNKDKEAQYSKKLNYIIDCYNDISLGKDIRIFEMKNWLEDIYSKNMKLCKNFYLKRELHYSLADIADTILSFLKTGISYYFLISSVLNNNLSAAEFLLYFTAINSFNSKIMGILNNFSKLYSESLEISTIREFLELPEQFLFEHGKALKPDKNNYEIELKNVYFRYPKAKDYTLHDFNLTIKSGEKLAVVGLNGAGKTTLIKLICGFLEPTDGEILLNGKNIKIYNRTDYYSLFSAVFQDFSLLELPIDENVAQTYKDIDEKKVKDCISKAGLTKKIEALPKQYKTPLGKKVFENGTALSGGEIQRLMLARALYKDSPIIVLDEPTAALDAIAENDIYCKYNELTSNKTSVYISHRLASTRFCDRIIFIADGTILEEGTHDELLKKGGEYAKLFHIQSHYYQKEGADNE